MEHRTSTIVLMAAFATPAALSQVFPNPQFEVGSFPTTVAAADLDGDGDIDLVTSDADHNFYTGFHPGTSVSVLLNRGDGTYERDSVVPSGVGPIAVALADFNGDGRPDITVANNETDDVSIMLNLGGGDFSPQQRYPASTEPFGIAVGDLDGDGHADVAVANLGVVGVNPGGITFMLNGGDGTFGPTRELRAGARPAAVAIGDLDGDGDAELLSGNFGSGDVTVFINDGNADFARQATYSLDTGDNEGPSSLALGDLDGDGFLDLAASNAAGWPSTGKLSILMNLGDGTFGPETGHEAGNNLRSVAVGDLNGDGAADVIAGSEFTSTVAVLFGDGAGGLAPVVHVNAGTSVKGVAIADLDGDGHPDIASANSGPDTVSVLRNDGQGGFATDDRYAVGEDARGVEAADIDGDGRRDLLVANGESHDLSLLRGAGDGRFETAVPFALGMFPSDVEAGDLDGDGDLDAAIAREGNFFPQLGPPGLSILLNEGGTFAPEATYDFADDDDAHAVALADVDRDGDLDAALAVIADTHTALLLSNNGDGTFGDPIPIGLGGDFSFTDIETADFNSDGAPDLATVRSYDDVIVVMLNDGSGGFPAESRLSSGSAFPLALAAGDYNGDGTADLAVAHGGVDGREGHVTVLRGDGLGGFGSAQTFGVGGRVRDIAATDLDGDGDLDLTAVNGSAWGSEGTVTVLLNDGAGDFDTFQLYGVGTGAVALTAADLDGDGLSDLATANSYNMEASVLVNTLGGCLADLDGDGDADGDDFFSYLDAFAHGELAVCDTDGDGDCDADDFFAYLDRFASGC